MKWEFDNSQPIYLQIVMNLKEMIVNGTYPPGTKVPSVRDLAMEAGVNPNTVQRAFTELERDGLLHTERTSGRIVSEDQEILHKMKTSLAEESISEMIHHLKKIGMSNEEIITLVQERVSTEKE